MAVFRVKKTQSYTVMCNHHFKDRSLSLKAKGLLSQILSLPDNWTYTLQGLSAINKEGIDSIRSAIKELEKSGYIVRYQGRTGNGKFGNNEYIVYEKPSLEKPSLDFPTTVNPIPDSTTLLNTERNILNKDQSIYPSSEDHDDETGDMADTIDGIVISKSAIKKNIEYEILSKRYSKERMDEIFYLIWDVVSSGKREIKIGGENLPAYEVKQRFLKINEEHVAYVIDCVGQNKTEIRNIKQYLLTTLYNAPTTMDHYYSSLVNHNYYGNDS